MAALTAAQPWAYAAIILGCLILLGLAAVNLRRVGRPTRRPTPDPVDEHYRTAAAVLAPDAADLPADPAEAARIDEMCERLITEAETALRNEAKRR